MKKFLTFILVLAMVLSVSSFAMAYEGDGSESNPYTVGNETDLSDAVGKGGSINIKLISGFELTNTLTIPAGVTVTLDLNGKTLSGVTVAASSSAVITNYGDLTVMDSDEGGKITAFAQNPDTADIPSYANNTITNYGTFTLKSGTIENATEGDNARACFPIDNNSTVADATTNIEGGKVTGRGAIRQYANSSTFKNTVNIKDGIVEGTSYGLWAQNPNNNKNPKAHLNIEGGTVSRVLLSTSSGFTGSITGGNIDKVEFWEPDTTDPDRNMSGFISGGEFSEEPADALLDSDAVTVGNTSDGFKVVKEVYTSEPVATVFPTFHDFGSIEQGGSFVPKTFTVINGGSTTIDVELPNIPKCMVEWVGGGSGKKTLTTITDGDYSAQFTVVPNASLAHGEYETDGEVNVYSLNGSNPLLTKDVEVEFKITAPATAPSTGGGYYYVGVRYNGGNSFSTDRSDVPVAVLIDGQPVGFTGNGSNFVVDCINPGASRITIVWNTIKVDARFTPDANAYCTQTVIPKTGGMSFWAAIAEFLGF